MTKKVIVGKYWSNFHYLISCHNCHQQESENAYMMYLVVNNIMLALDLLHQVESSYKTYMQSVII